MTRKAEMWVHRAWSDAERALPRTVEPHPMALAPCAHGVLRFHGPRMWCAECDRDVTDEVRAWARHDEINPCFRSGDIA